MIHKYLLASALLALISSSVGAQSVRAGIDAWQHADYAQAVAIWRPLAERGDADAAFNLGQAYRLGRGVPTNLAAAQTWFERAAAKGHVDAQTTLGLMLFENGDRSAGIRWLKPAAEKGEPRALLVYGTALFNGDGVKQDPILGYAYVSRAAAQGLAPAQATLEQLDQILPLEQRKKALALAMARAKSAPPPSLKPVGVPPTKPLPKTAPVQTASAKPVKASPSIAPTPKETMQQITVKAGGWTMQLGAFSKRSSAEALYHRLASSGALHGMQPHYVMVGPLTKLRVGSFETRSAAAAACASLKGQACFPVPAK
jgi:TPR repeat protein